MWSVQALIAAGPCLIASITAAALLLVYRTMTEVRHAILWSAAFAITGLRWAIIARYGAAGLASPGTGMDYSPLGIIAAALLAEGFAVRARGMRSHNIAIVLAAVAVQSVMFLAPANMWRRILIPLAASFLTARAATLVVLPARRAAVVERIVVAIVALAAIVELCCALLAVGYRSGLILAIDADGGLYALTLQPVLAGLAMALMLLIAFDSAIEQQRLVETDPLTGVLNRMGFERAARASLGRRPQLPITLVLADLDHFKAINDRFGHAAGDQTLIGFARLLAGAVARRDAVGRWGGEEFALLLPGRAGPAAYESVERIRRASVGLAIFGDPGARVTASFGVAERRPGETLDQLIARADAALYQSKRAGRDRTTLASAGPGRPGA